VIQISRFYYGAVSLYRLGLVFKLLDAAVQNYVGDAIFFIE